MIDTEARVRATLDAVAAATALHPPQYVEPERRRKRLLVPALVAAAAAAFAFAAVVPEPDHRAEQAPASQSEGRRLTEGTVGGRRWALHGVDQEGTPCVALSVEGRQTTAPLCSLERTDAPAHTIWFERLASIPEGDQVVLVAASSHDVEKVLVAADDRPASEATVVDDPAHPGLRYVVTVLDAAARTLRLTIRTLRGDGTVLESNVQDVGP